MLEILVGWLHESLQDPRKCNLLCPLEDRQFDLIQEILRQGISSNLAIHATIMRALDILHSWLLPAPSSAARSGATVAFPRPLPFMEESSIQHNKRFIVQLVQDVFFLEPKSDEEWRVHSMVARKVVDLYRAAVEEREYDPSTW